MIGSGKRKHWKTLIKYPWSSLPAYLGWKSKRPDWLKVERVLGELGLRDESCGRRDYGKLLEGIRQGEADFSEKDEKVRSECYLGAEAFQDRLIDRLEPVKPSRKRENLSGEAVREVDEREAQRLITRGRELLELRTDQLNRSAKNDSRKQALAWLVRSQTCVANAWVAEKLQMGHVANVSRAVKRMRERRDKEARELRIKLGLISICKD